MIRSTCLVVFSTLMFACGDEAQSLNSEFRLRKDALSFICADESQLNNLEAKLIVSGDVPFCPLTVDEESLVASGLCEDIVVTRSIRPMVVLWEKALGQADTDPRVLLAAQLAQADFCENPPMKDGPDTLDLEFDLNELVYTDDVVENFGDTFPARPSCNLDSSEPLRETKAFFKLEMYRNPQFYAEQGITNYGNFIKPFDMDNDGISNFEELCDNTL